MELSSELKGRALERRTRLCGVELKRGKGKKGKKNIWREVEEGDFGDGIYLVTAMIQLAPPPGIFIIEHAKPSN